MSCDNLDLTYGMKIVVETNCSRFKSHRPPEYL